METCCVRLFSLHNHWMQMRSGSSLKVSCTAPLLYAAPKLNVWWLSLMSRSQNRAADWRGKRNEWALLPLILRTPGCELGKGIKTYKATNTLTDLFLSIFLIPKFELGHQHAGIYRNKMLLMQFRKAVPLLWEGARVLHHVTCKSCAEIVRLMDAAWYKRESRSTPISLGLCFRSLIYSLHMQI